MIYFSVKARSLESNSFALAIYDSAARSICSRASASTAVYSGVVKLTGCPSTSVSVPDASREENAPSSSKATVPPVLVPLITAGGVYGSYGS